MPVSATVTFRHSPETWDFDAGASWPPLAAGLFGGSAERLEESLGRWRKHVEEARRQARFRHVR